MTNSDLRERAEKIIRLMDEAEALRTEIADRFADAKNHGYSVTALRKAIRVTRMDGKARARHDADAEQFDLFLAEIEGTSARSLKEAAE